MCIDRAPHMRFKHITVHSYAGFTKRPCMKRELANAMSVPMRGLLLHTSSAAANPQAYTVCT